jgi:hypothetical protein
VLRVEAQSAVTAVLRIGLRIAHDGQVFTVVELGGRRMLLEPEIGDARQVDIGWLLSHPTTSVLGGESPAELSPGTLLSVLDGVADDELTQRVRHVQEVITGFQLGSAELALEGEPRSQYAPTTGRMDRYAAKATELGVSVMTVRRMVMAFAAKGPVGLLAEARPRDRLGRVDACWLDMCQIVLAEHTDASRPTHAIVLARIQERLAQEYGQGAVSLPGKTKGYQLLAELSRGSNAFTGSTKGKRSIANRPVGVYGSLRATRPGEYVLLDTTRLDVFAMEPVTCRWVQVELTAAMDLYTRCSRGCG